MSDRWSGDPALILSNEGADIDVEGGQPVMDAGVRNQALISIFTELGWCGNAYIADPKQQIGSAYEKTTRQAVTRQSLIDIANEGVAAVKSDYFPNPSVTVENPTGSNLDITLDLGPGQIVLKRTRLSWAAQADDPASGRLINTT